MTEREKHGIFVMVGGWLMFIVLLATGVQPALALFAPIAWMMNCYYTGHDK